MLEFNDARWMGLLGGRREQFDPRPALNQLASGATPDDSWSELWDGLYHQGDVDTAAYAAVPHLVSIHRRRDVPDWNTFSMLGAIELARRNDDNPSIPDFLRDPYQAAWREVVPLALRDLARTEDQLIARTCLGVIALARGLIRAGEVLLDFTEDELDEMVSRY